MSGRWMYDNSVPYQFSRAPERMYAQAPLRRGQPSYRVVAPSEQGYIPVDRQGYSRAYPREQGFVPVHSFPEDLEHFYGVRPREPSQFYRAPPRSHLPYVSAPPLEAYDSYVPVVRPGSHPMVDMVPARDGGFGWRQAYDGPVRLPTKQEWESRGPYRGMPPDGEAFRPVYGDAGSDQPEPMADLTMEEDRAPYYFVRAPSLQQGRRPIAVRDVSGVPHLVIGGAGNEDADSRHVMRKVCDSESVRDVLVRDGEKDGNRLGSQAAVSAAVPSVRSIPVRDGAVTTGAQGGATKRKEEKGRTSDGNARQGLLKRGFLAPAATKSRSTSPTSERRDQEKHSVTYSNGKEDSATKSRSTSPTSERRDQEKHSVAHSNGKEDSATKSRSTSPTSERRDQEKSSATHSNGKEDSAGRYGGRVFTVPLAKLENDNLDKVMKAIFDAMSEGKSSRSGGETQAPKATAPTAQHLDGSDTKQEVTKAGPTVAQESKLSESKRLVNVNKEATKPLTGSEEVRGEQQPSGAKSDEAKTEEVVKPQEQAILKVPIEEDEAARRIQALSRGYSLRRTKPLEKVRAIARVRSRLRELEGLLADQEAYATLMKDPKERLRVTETVMALLLQLDSIQGVHPSVRDLRKVVAHDLTRLQDTLDAKLREMSLSTSDVESEKTAELCKGEVDEQVDAAQQNTEEEVVTTREASEVGQSEVAQGYPNDEAVGTLNNTDRSEDGEADATVVESLEDTACGQHKEAADGSSGVEESAEHGCHVTVKVDLPATSADDMLDRETRVSESTSVEGVVQGGQEVTLVVELGRDGKALEDESRGKELEDESRGADRVAQVGSVVTAEEVASVAKGITAEVGGRQGDEAVGSSVEGTAEIKPHVMPQADRSSDTQKLSLDTSGPEKVGVVAKVEEDLLVDLAPNGDEVVMAASDGENSVAASSAGAVDSDTKIELGLELPSTAQGGEEAIRLVEVGRDGKEREDGSCGREFEDGSSGADRVAQVDPLVMVEEEAPVAKGIMAEAGGRQGDEARDSSVEGAVEVKPHVMFLADRSSDGQKPSFDTSGPEEVGTVVKPAEDFARNGDEVVMSAIDGENSFAASSAGAVDIDFKVELGLELPAIASDEAHVVDVADAWQELETKFYGVEDNKELPGTVFQELGQISTTRGCPEAISSTTKEESLLASGDDEGVHAETVNVGGNLTNDDIMDVASSPAPILSESDDMVPFDEQEICKSPTSHEQQPLHDALTSPPCQLGACASTKEKLQVPSSLASSQDCPVAEDMDEVDETILMRHLIEENRKLKALVQTLVGLSQAQTRSVVDRLDRLESRVCDSSKTRDHPRRRLVTRRRK